jgi:hypothetical protein
MSAGYRRPIRQPGGPEAIEREDFDRLPEPGPDEVGVRDSAFGLNSISPTKSKRIQTAARAYNLLSLNEAHSAPQRNPLRSLDCIYQMSQNKPRPKLSEKGLLTADNCVVAIIDLQPQMLFGVGNFD